MSTVETSISKSKLATHAGEPNTLTFDYSTDVLLPVEGPVFFSTIIVSFRRMLVELNEFLLLIELIKKLFDKGVRFGQIFVRTDQQAEMRLQRWKYDAEVVPAVKKAIRDMENSQRRSIFESLFGGWRDSLQDMAWKEARRKVLEWLSKPGRVIRDAYEAGLISRDFQTLVAEDLLTTGFNERCNLILTRFVRLYRDTAPDHINDIVEHMIREAFNQAGRKHPSFRDDLFSALPDPVFQLLGRWLVGRYISDKKPSGIVAGNEVADILGFVPLFSMREWAFRRDERLVMQFGTPDIRGPLKTEAIPPQGMYEHEEYRAVENELSVVAEKSREETTREISSELRDRLNSIYYAGPGTIGELTGNSSNLSLSEDRKNTVLSILRQVSMRSTTAFSERRTTNVSVTTAYSIPGVDERRSCTIHRFKVALPVESKIYLHDVGLTWTPRIFNPFMALRESIRRVYDNTVQQYMKQYYVPEPVRPPVVWERYVAVANILIEEGNIWGGTASVDRKFTIYVNPTEGRFDKPDFSSATVSWNQNESALNDDPDTWSIWLEDLFYSNGTISGRIRMETTDGGADFDGTAHIEVPMLRWSEESVSAMATFEAQMREHEKKLQSIQAQAHQYAKIKQREVIERHERYDSITRIVFEELIRRSYSFGLDENLSYLNEVISRCIDWDNARIVFESADMRHLNYPEFPPDHFMNSMAVRLFLPVYRASEELLLDTLSESGNFFMRHSVETVRNKISRAREELANSEPELLDEFSSQMIIGDHMEAVLSKYAHGT